MKCRVITNTMRCPLNNYCYILYFPSVGNDDGLLQQSNENVKLITNRRTSCHCMPSEFG